MNVGSMIKKLRKERHMTQLELSEALNCTKQTISNYEHGRREPDYATLKAIAEALDAPVSLFLTDAEQERMLWEEPSDTYGRESAAEMELWEIREAMRRNPEIRTMFSLTKNATPEDLKKMLVIIKTLRGDE